MEKLANDCLYSEEEMRNVMDDAQPPSAEDLLARIGALRREVGRLDLEIVSAKGRLERSEEFLNLRELKEERKEMLQLLDVALWHTERYAQPRLM